MAPRHLAVRESSGKKYREHEDAIIRQFVLAKVPTKQFVHLLPGRTARSVDSRAHVLQLESRRSDERKKRRFLYVPEVLDDALNVFAEHAGTTWSQYVIAAIEEKIAREAESYLADE